jgi:hypothetical protein
LIPDGFSFTLPGRNSCGREALLVWKRSKVSTTDPWSGPAKEGLSWTTVLGSTISVLAFGISIYSTLELASTRRYAAGAEAVQVSYQLYRELTRTAVDHPDQGHLFIPGTSSRRYQGTVLRVRRVANRSGQDRERLLIEEAALADYILTSYEQLFFNWSYARNVGRDPDREEFLDLGLKGYYVDLLCNRRLRWYWNEDGGNLVQNYSPALVEEYERSVRPNCKGEPDSDGPFTNRNVAEGGKE